MKKIIVILSVIFPSFVFAQAEIAKGTLLGLSKPLSEVAHKATPNMNDYKKKFKNDWKNIPNFSQQIPMPTPNAKEALPKNGDPLASLSKNPPINRGPVILDQILEGTNQALSGVLPPDPDGDNGANHYIQAVNGNGTTIIIWDKEGNVVEGPMSLNVLWNQFGVNGLGDPIICYDQEYDRWILTEFQANGNALLVAVSETPDPTGSYYSYRFPTQLFPDYPKFGLWHDALYVTTNEGASPFIPVYIIDREDLINGVETDMIRVPGLNKPNTNAFVFNIATPAEWDGTTPPPDGAPHYNVRMVDDAWGTGSADGIEIWEAYYDKEEPSNSRMEGPIKIDLAPFDSDLCGNSIFNCIDQPGPGTISALQHVIFNQAQYRNFTEYEMMLMTFSIDVGDNIAGTRWVEVRKYPGGQWELYQEGTHSPTEGQSNLQPAVAMDGSGNIGLAYSVVDPDSTYLGLRVTGRLASDSLGTMTYEETLIVEGGSDNPFQRWGDYTSLSVDPIDEKTFWYTGEYMLGNGNWATKVAKFVLKVDTFDMGVVSLNTPSSSQDLTAAETVTATFRNFGLEDQDNFTVGLMVDGELIVEDEVNLLVEEAAAYEHTFSSTIDMDEIRPYEISIYVSAPNDQNGLNDMGNYTRTKLPRFDAAIIDVQGVDPLICGSFVNVDVTIENQGEENLTSFLLDATINGETQTFEYMGDLAKGDIYTHTFAITNFVMGDNTIEYVVYNPNGMTDEYNVNDNASSMFSYDPGTERLSLRLEPDFYSSETSWQLIDDEGNVVLSENYPTNDIGEQAINLCTNPACYTFVLKDSYGDGWSWGGNPGFEWTDENGNILAQLITPNFGSEAQFEFCFPFECMIDLDLQTVNASDGSAADGRIIAEVINGIPPFEFSIDGVDQGSDNTFNDLPAGDYSISVIDANGCETSGVVSIGFDSNVEDLANDIKVTIAPNPNDGFFQVQVEGLSDVHNLRASLMDQTGAIVYDRDLVNFNGVQHGQFTTKNLPAGQYYLWFRDAAFNKLYKVVKN